MPFGVDDGTEQLLFRTISWAAVIAGAEPVKNWKKVEENWFVASFRAHTVEVYLPDASKTDGRF